MKRKIVFTLAILAFFHSAIFSQEQNAPQLYKHKVSVQEVIQTKSYTYLKVKEIIKEKDSLQWLALPSFSPKIGDVYYFESGLQMGKFQSKELNRSFDDITFLNGLSTSPEISDKNIVPEPVKDTTQVDLTPPVVHTVIVKEVLQAGGYTYLRVMEGAKEEWVAVVRVNALVGQTFTYNDAAPMTNFTSKELKRTFPEVLFISKLNYVDEKDQTKTESKDPHSSFHSKDTQVKKPALKDLKITPVDGGISLAELLKNKSSYAGKIVKIKGEVTKFSADILNSNWIHIEDGTQYNGTADLTITSNQKVSVGDIVIFEGKVALARDFGSGYFFDLIVEDAKIINQ